MPRTDELTELQEPVDPRAKYRCVQCGRLFTKLSRPMLCRECLKGRV